MEGRDPGDETAVPSKEFVEGYHVGYGQAYNDHSVHGTGRADLPRCALCGRTEPAYVAESDGYITVGEYAGRNIRIGELFCELDVIKTLAKDGNGSFVLVRQYA